VLSPINRENRPYLPHLGQIQPLFSGSNSVPHAPHTKRSGTPIGCGAAPETRGLRPAARPVLRPRRDAITANAIRKRTISKRVINCYRSRSGAFVERLESIFVLGHDIAAFELQRRSQHVIGRAQLFGRKHEIADRLVAFEIAAVKRDLFAKQLTRARVIEQRLAPRRNAVRNGPGRV
jgi:hypothetical protein